MRIIRQLAVWEVPPRDDAMECIERIGRVCYKSEDKITASSAGDFVHRILESNHESVIEHIAASVRFVTDRGVTHEMVRHRIASYSQESTRYCNYCKDKFGNEITVVLPVDFYDIGIMIPPTPVGSQYRDWCVAMKECEQQYFHMISNGANAQLARSVLPNSLKTEIVMSANLREWRHFFKLRTAKAAHPQMRELAIQALKLFQHKLPVLFNEFTFQ